MTLKPIKKALGLAILGSATLAGGQAQAANWLMLQGTEPSDSAGRAKVWGFIQAQYQKDTSDPNAGGAYVPPKLVGPNLQSQSAFNVNRARIGVRGVNFPLDSKTNYFVLLEMGNNGITAGGSSFAKATDASVTFSHIPFARVRAGLFKYPGAEEGLQAIHVFDYINFTNVSNQMLLERFPNQAYTSDQGPQKIPPENNFNKFEKPVGAFRDVGIQVFDAIKVGAWEHSYALMYGNGNGLNYSDNDSNKDIYAYLSSEWIMGGKGPRTEGLKMFGWMQSGKRTADLTNDATHNPVAYDRDRWGVGAKFLKKPWRATAEYMAGEGMIFNGPDKPSFGLIPPAAGNPTHEANGAFAKANGFYLEGGFYIPKTNWELDLRYDQYNRLEGSQFELQFVTTTLGAQYFFNKKTRVAFNYEIREAEAINIGTNAPNPNPNGNLKGVDDRYGLQITAIF